MYINMHTKSSTDMHRQEEVQLDIFDQTLEEWILLMDGDPINQERPRVRTALPSTVPKLTAPVIEFENPVPGSVLLIR